MLAVIPILFLGLLAGTSPALQPKEPDRIMCDEVAHEINDMYIDGEISREDATRIIDRCYLLFDK